MAFLFNGRSLKNIDFNGNPVSKVVCGGVVIWAKVRKVKYIKSHRTEYIDTGYKPNSHTRVQIDFVCLEPSDVKAVFGGRIAAGQEGISFFAGVNTKSWFQYANSNYHDGKPIMYDCRYIVDANRNILTVTSENEKIDEIIREPADFQSPASIMIFTVNNNGIPDGRYSCIKLYGCKIWDNDVLVRDFTPCLDGTGTPCLYDEVEQKFYYNSGKGNFEYEELEEI